MRVLAAIALACSLGLAAPSGCARRPAGTGVLRIDLARVLQSIAPGQCVSGVVSAFSVDEEGTQRSTVRDLPFDSCSQSEVLVPCTDGRDGDDTTLLIETRTAGPFALGARTPLHRTEALRADCRAHTELRVAGGASVALGETGADGTTTVSIDVHASVVSLGFLQQTSCSIPDGHRTWVAAPKDLRRMTLLEGVVTSDGEQPRPLDAALLAAHGAISLSPTEVSAPEGDLLSLRYGLRFDWPGHALANSIQDLLLPGPDVDALLAAGSGVLSLAQVPRVSASATFANAGTGCGAPSTSEVKLLSKLQLSFAGAAVVGTQQEIVDGATIRMARVSGVIEGTGLAPGPGFVSAQSEFSDAALVGLGACPSTALLVIARDALDGRLFAVSPLWDGSAFAFTVESLEPGSPAFSACFDP